MDAGLDRRTNIGAMVETTAIESRDETMVKGAREESVIGARAELPAGILENVKILEGILGGPGGTDRGGDVK